MGEFVLKVVSQAQLSNLVQTKQILNVNFPLGQIKGFKSTNISKQLMFEVKPIIENGSFTYMKYAPTQNVPEERSDAWAVSLGYISVGMYCMN